jgi:hypothetical protein
VGSIFHALLCYYEPAIVSVALYENTAAYFHASLWYSTIWRPVVMLPCGTMCMTTAHASLLYNVAANVHAPLRTIWRPMLLVHS